MTIDETLNRDLLLLRPSCVFNLLSNLFAEVSDHVLDRRVVMASMHGLLGLLRDDFGLSEELLVHQSRVRKFALLTWLHLLWVSIPACNDLVEWL